MRTHKIKLFLSKWLPKRFTKFMASVYMYSLGRQDTCIETVLLSESFIEIEYDKLRKRKEIVEKSYDNLEQVFNAHLRQFYAKLDTVLETYKKNETVQSGGQNTLLPKHEPLPEQSSVGQVQQTLSVDEKPL